jgi:hypothetical protein
MKTKPNDSASPMVLNDDNFASANHQWGLTKLEAFTMAAMQGLCQGKKTADIKMGECVDIGECALLIAKATIEALNQESR